MKPFFANIKASLLKAAKWFVALPKTTQIFSAVSAGVVLVGSVTGIAISTAHRHEYTTTVTPPTCLEQGYTTYECECGKKYTDDYISKNGHTISEWITYKNPTCTENGSKHQICAVCEATIKTEDITALGHTGVICSVCGFVDPGYVPSHTHNYSSTVTLPTCTASGYTTYTCECGDSYSSDNVPAIAHSYINNICSSCGAVDPDYQASHTHSYSTVVTPPTCTASGYTTYTCQCGDSYSSDNVPTIAHSYINGICSSCGAVDPDYQAPHKHSYSTVVTPPTCTTNGYTTYTCECGDNYTLDTNSKLGHDYNDGFCKNCGAEPSPSIGLKYKLSSDGTYYTLIGIGSCKDKTIIIPEVYNDIPVTTIDGAFKQCKNITSVIVPNSVTRITDSTFYECTALESLTLPFVGITATTSDYDYKYSFGVIFGKTSYSSGVKTEQCYFDSKGNSHTATYYIPESLKSVTITGGIIRTGAFKNCSTLTNVTLPDELTTFPDSLFSGCTALTDITISDKITEIGNYVFSTCSSLTTMTIPNSVTKMGSYTFADCINLSDVTLSNTLSVIPINAFSNCKSLISITIPDSVTLIATSAFSVCSNLTSVIIPDSVTRIEYQAFFACQALTDITFGNGLTCIGNQAFVACNSLTSITIPQSVTSILDAAFQYCSGLTSVVIPDSVTEIGSQAFAYCDNLTSITLPKRLENFATNTILGCTSLKNLTIPLKCSITVSDTMSLDEITIPVSTTFKSGNFTSWNIGVVNYPGTTSEWKGSFSKKFHSSVTVNYEANTTYDEESGLRYTSYGDGTCYVDRIYTKILKSYVIPSISPNGDNVIDIVATFTDYNIKNITISEGITSIGANLFKNSYINQITLPSTLTKIGDYAFYNCYSLKSISIPDGVEIGANAFYSCSSLSDVTLGSNLIIGEYAFLFCNSLSSIVIQDGTIIEDYAFSQCTKLSSVTFGKISSIGENVFYNCNVKNITFTGTVQEWSDTEGCSALTNVTVDCTDGKVKQ